MQAKVSPLFLLLKRTAAQSDRNNSRRKRNGRHGCQGNTFNVKSTKQNRIKGTWDESISACDVTKYKDSNNMETVNDRLLWEKVRTYTPIIYII